MYKCLICYKEYNLLGHLSAHIHQKHNLSYKDYYDKFLKTQNDGKCKTCGKETTFYKGKYTNFCSKVCSNKHPENRKKNSDGVKKAKAIWTEEKHKEVNNKRNETMLKNYGIENISQLEENKEKVRKYWNEMDQSYFKELLERRENTCLEKYGVKNPLQSEDIKNKVITTNLKRYGMSIASKSQSIKNKQSKIKLIQTYNKLVRFNKHIIPLFKIEEYHGNHNTREYEWKCVKCNNNFKYKYLNGIMPKCPICYPPLKSEEINIENIIKQFYKGNIIRNTRSIINGELDYFFPDLNVAIEYDGLYWHTELSNNKNKNYHLNKTEMCSYNNIKLIHIFEDEWLNNKKIVISRIKNSLKCIKRKIYARKCITKQIDSNIANKFLNKYHIQGACNSSVYLGAFYKNRLISVMSFGKNRKALGLAHKENCWELIRFCSVLNFNIVGIGSKLLSYFEKNYNPQKIISYADRRWSNGNFYTQIGFTLDHISRPNYWYVPLTGQKRFHRFNFRKQILSKKLETYNPDLSEWENMQLNGYDRIWDCGNYVFIKNYPIKNFGGSTSAKP
jgi:hypothetical protein